MAGYRYKATGDNVSRNDFMDRADLLTERNRLYADNCDLEAECNKLRAIKYELLAALHLIVSALEAPETMRESVALTRLPILKAAIARAEGRS